MQNKGLRENRARWYLAGYFQKMKTLQLLWHFKKGFQKKQQTEHTKTRLMGLGGMLPLRCLYFQRPQYPCLQTTLPMSFMCCHQHKSYPNWNLKNQLLAQRPKSQVTFKNQIHWKRSFCIHLRLWNWRAPFLVKESSDDYSVVMMLKKLRPFLFP